MKKEKKMNQNAETVERVERERERERAVIQKMKQAWYTMLY